MSMKPATAMKRLPEQRRKKENSRFPTVRRSGTFTVNFSIWLKAEGLRKEKKEQKEKLKEKIKLQKKQQRKEKRKIIWNKITGFFSKKQKDENKNEILLIESDSDDSSKK